MNQHTIDLIRNCTKFVENVDIQLPKFEKRKHKQELPVIEVKKTDDGLYCCGFIFTSIGTVICKGSYESITTHFKDSLPCHAMIHIYRSGYKDKAWVILGKYTYIDPKYDIHLKLQCVHDKDRLKKYKLPSSHKRWILFEETFVKMFTCQHCLAKHSREDVANSASISRMIYHCSRCGKMSTIILSTVENVRIVNHWRRLPSVYLNEFDQYNTKSETKEISKFDLLDE